MAEKDLKGFVKIAKSEGYSDQEIKKNLKKKGYSYSEINESIGSVPKKNLDVKHDEYMKKRKVNWVLTLVMSIIFGGLGVDRFIMGHVGLGLLKLITAGGCGIWWLIDIILIATKYEFQDILWVT